LRGLIRPILLVALVLAIPVLPFVGFGHRMEDWITSQLDRTVSPAVVSAMVVGLLATDVFLPVPSSVISTVAGEVLGFWAGTGASWLGMTAGAVFAFGLARVFGRPLASWLSGREDLARIDAASSRAGPLVLVLARPVPVLAEASVLFLGATRLPWTWFLVPVALSNLGIAAAYAALGRWVQLPVAVAASVVLPLVAGAIARRWWPSTDPNQAAEEEVP
jgi:uncharacterized membrane protein YdjX (TVP38/TMEM64 family)